MQKFMRVQGREISFKTKKPAGLFALCWRRIRDGIFSAEDEAEFRALDVWFRANLPIPPFYDENEHKFLDAGKPLPVTWFKTDCPPKMKEKTEEIISLLDKYEIPYDVVYSNYVGRIIYEDEFQIGVTEPEVEIRSVTKEELPEVLELIHKSFATVAANLGFTKENCPGHTSFMPMEKLMNFYEWGFLMYGLFEDGKLTGYFSLAKMPDGRYELNNLSVLPEKRHAGYGSMMIDFAKKKVAELGADAILLSIIEDSWVIKNYYQMHGFKHIGTQKFEHLPFTCGFMEFRVCDKAKSTE